MIVKLPKDAHWNGTPIEAMNACELRLILAYKIHELAVAVELMNDSQKSAIKEAMNKVHVPMIVRKKKTGL